VRLHTEEANTALGAAAKQIASELRRMLRDPSDLRHEEELALALYLFGKAVSEETRKEVRRA
jgi:hypothetical protein